MWDDYKNGHVRGPIQYAQSGDVSIANQVTGDGPFDLVLVPGFISHLEFDWEEPRHAAFLERLASFSRLIRLDKRGTGLSDRHGGIADLETRMDDVRAVMDAVGSERAAVFGYFEGGPMSILFAATYPERTQALIPTQTRRCTTGGVLANVSAAVRVRSAN
jgi:pimeloyl-ACP methyl ester carboxylesterase